MADYLYVLHGADGRVLYVGIGSRERPYEIHNDDYEAAIESSSDVRITSRPFSSREDAELAESVLIRTLVDANRAGKTLVNRAKVLSHNDLVPLLPVAEGVVLYSDLSNAIIVKVSPKDLLDARGVVTGVSQDAAAAVRCQKWWSIGAAIRRGDDIRTLVAVSTKLRGVSRVLGSWATASVDQWYFEPDGGVIELLKPADGDVLGTRGQSFDWEGYGAQGFGYSSDVRDSWH